MERGLIEFALNVLNLIIAKMANNTARRSLIAAKIETGEKLTMDDLGFLSDETNSLLDQGERM